MVRLFAVVFCVFTSIPRAIPRSRLPDTIACAQLRLGGQHGEALRLVGPFDDSLQPADILAEIGDLLPVRVELVLHLPFQAKAVFTGLVEPALHLGPELGELSLHPIELSLYSIELLLYPVELLLHPVELPLYPVELLMHSVELPLHLVELPLSVGLGFGESPIHVPEHPGSERAQGGDDADHRGDDADHYRDRFSR